MDPMAAPSPSISSRMMVVTQNSLSGKGSHQVGFSTEASSLGNFDMDKIWEEVDRQSMEAQVQPQQHVVSDAAIIAGQQVTLENFLGKPEFVKEGFPGKESITFKMGPRQENLMQHASGHDPTVMNNNSGRKRMVRDVEFMERQMKRMIRNRESAARSRAKKQAHIAELETKLENLKEENIRLKAENRNNMKIKHEPATEKALKQLNMEMTSKKSGRAMHRRSNTCMW